MPYVLAFNRPAIEDKLALLARVLGLPGSGFAAVLDWILGLRERIGIPHRLAALGVTPEHVPVMTPMAVEDPSSPTNPVPLDAAACARLYAAALAGDVRG